LEALHIEFVAIDWLDEVEADGEASGLGAQLQPGNRRLQSLAQKQNLSHGTAG